MKAVMRMDHAVDPKLELLDQLGDLTGFELMWNQVLVAIYVRPEKTKSGIILVDKSRDEDRYQGKAGLVVKIGPDAFKDDEHTKFNGQSVTLLDWVWFRPSDGQQVTVNGVLCRAFDDERLIRGKIPTPDYVY